MKDRLAGFIAVLSICVITGWVLYKIKSYEQLLCEEGTIAIGKTLGEIDRSGVHKVVYEYFVENKRYLGVRTVGLNMKVPNGYYVVVYYNLDPELSYMLFEYSQEVYDKQSLQELDIDCKYIDGGDVSQLTASEKRRFSN